jgi:hypothetical protein
MSLDRKILTAIAILAFVISASNASWEVRYEINGQIKDTQIVTSPIWQPPDNLSKSFTTPEVGGFDDTNWATGRPYLLTAPLAGIWIAIWIVYAGVFFMLKGTNFSGRIFKKQTPKK